MITHMANNLGRTAPSDLPECPQCAQMAKMMRDPAAAPAFLRAVLPPELAELLDLDQAKLVDVDLEWLREDPR